MNKQKLYELMSQRADAMKRAETALSEGKQTEYDAEMETVKGLNTQIEAWEALEAQKGLHQLPTAPAAPAVEKGEPETGYQKAVKALANAARNKFEVSKAVQEGQMFNTAVDADGGYLVPEDIVGRIFKLAEEEESLLDEVTVFNVTTQSGRRTLKKRSQYTGFATVEEAAEYPLLATPKFSTISYNIKKRGGITAATAELVNYSDADIAAFIESWLSGEARATANRLILEKIQTKDQVAMTGADDIIKNWVKLGAAFRNGSKLITNDDGLAWLATLKGEDGGYLLKPVISETGELQFAVGPHVLRVKVYSNNTLPSTGTKAPVIIGDLKSGIAYWLFKAFSILPTNVGVVGALNAFSQNLLLLRGDMWNDATTWDTDAFINGSVDTAAV